MVMRGGPRGHRGHCGDEGRAAGDTEDTVVMRATGDTEDTVVMRGGPRGTQRTLW